MAAFGGDRGIQRGGGGRDYEGAQGNSGLIRAYTPIKTYQTVYLKYVQFSVVCPLQHSKAVFKKNQMLRHLTG